MPRRRQPVDPQGTISQVIELERVERSPWRRKRLQAIRLAAEGQEGYRRIAQIVGCTAATLCKWVAWYRQGGIEALLDRQNGAGGGRKPRFSPEQWARFKEALEANLWRTALQAQAWLERELGLSIAIKEVYRHLGKLGARLKVARRSHAKKDHAASEAFRNGGLGEKLGELDIPKGRPVRVWVVDEARFGLHTEHRRVWALRGQRVSVPHQQRYEWDYTYGAVGVGHAGSVFHFHPTVSLRNYESFLREIGEYYPGAIHVVIQDGAGFHHRAGDERLPDNVRVVNLPPYSPELNPVEKLWDQIKDTTCNQVFESVESLRSKITGWLEGFWEDGTRAWRLIGDGWLRSQVNAGSKNCRF